MERAGPAEEITLSKVDTDRPELWKTCFLLDKFRYTLDLKPMRNVID
jgi:hypothetical protein